MLDMFINQQINNVIKNQRKMIFSFSAILLYSKQKINVIIVLTEHFIYIFEYNNIIKRFDILKHIHLFDIKHIQIKDENRIILELFESKKIIQIVSSNCIEFIRLLKQSYGLFSILIPRKSKLSISSNGSIKIPDFEPILTISQEFQLLYYAFCSLYKTNYFHQIPNYIHSLAQNLNPFFDFSFLPPHLVESSLGDSLLIQPLISALCFYKYVCSFYCNRCTSINLVSAIVPLIKSNFKIICLIDVGAVNGCNEIAGIINQSKDHSVLFWDLSGNKLNDIIAFNSVLMNYNTYIYGLKLDNMLMNDQDIYFLFRSLISNKYLYNIKELSLKGNRISKKNCVLIHEWLWTLKEKRHFKLRILSLGPIESPCIVSNAICNSLQPIEKLTFFGDNSANDLYFNKIINFVNITQTLKSINISRCKLSPASFDTFLKSIIENKNIPEICLNLSFLRMHGEKFNCFLYHIMNGLGEKINGLGVGFNDFTEEELNSLCMYVNKLPNIKSLDLSGNFGTKDSNISQIILGVLTSKTLEKLIIQGCENHYLREQIIPILCGLYDNKNILYIDIGNNKIGDIGLRTAANLLKVNSHICSIEIDNNDIKNMDTMEYYLNSCAESTSLLEGRIPNNDIYNLFSKSTYKSNKEKVEKFERISRIQTKINEALLRNMKQMGISTELLLQNDSVLEEVVHLSEERYKDCKPKLTNQCNLFPLVGIPNPDTCI